MKILPFEDTLDTYIKLRYPNKIIVRINTDYGDNEWVFPKWLDDFAYENKIPFEDLVEGNLFIEFDTEDEAIDFCNSVPDSYPYCCVYENGEVIHENT